jgi:hypothetical protein
MLKKEKIARVNINENETERPQFYNTIRKASDKLVVILELSMEQVNSDITTKMIVS